MMNKMIIANLVHRPIRSLISISAVALEVILILLIVSFFYGQLNGSKASQVGVGADVMVLPPGSSGIVAVSGAPIPVKVGDILRKLPNPRWRLSTASTSTAITVFLPPCTFSPAVLFRSLMM
jgi:putative ABC transport system permease protein